MRAAPDSINGFEKLLKLNLATETTGLSKVIESLLARRPVDLELHRKFQDVLMDSRTETGALIRRYDEYIQADRENSQLLYLRGRLEATIDPGNVYFAKAIEMDPQNNFALYALGRNYMSACEFTEAQKSFQRLVLLKPEDETYQSEYIRSMYASKDLVALRNQVNLKPDTMHEFYFAAHYLKLSGKEEQFAQIRTAILNGRVELVNATLAYLNGDIDTFKKSALRSRVYDESARWGKRLQIGIETGDVSDMLWLLERLSEIDSDQTLPMMAVVLKRAGKPEEARQIWNRFVDRMAKRHGAEKLLAKLAKEGEFKQVDIEEFRQLAIWALHKRPYALGFREFTKDAGPEWDDEIRALNFERWFPYNFVKNAIAKE